MTFAFLSHSSKDNLIVEELAKRLGEENIFYDKWNLDAGELLPSKLSEVIYDSKWFVLIASKNSMASSWVKYELNIAIRRHIEDENYRIIVAKIDDCEMHHELAPFVYIDTSENPKNAINKIVELILSKGKGILEPKKDWHREIVGRYSEMEAIEKSSYEGIRFIYLWGYFGIGKSTLVENSARQVFNSRIACFNLTEGHDLLRLSLEMASRSKSSIPSPTASDEELLLSIRESTDQLNQQNYIVFFDKVQNALNDDGTLRKYLIDVLRNIEYLEDNPIVFLASTYYPKIEEFLEEISHIMKVRPLNDEHLLFCLQKWTKLADPSAALPDRKQLKTIVKHLHGYPLAARFTAYLIMKYSVDAVLEDIQVFSKLRIDVVKQLLGRTNLDLTDIESNCLEVLTVSDTGLSLNELSESIETDVEEVRIAVDNLYSAMLVTLERKRLQIIPIAKDYFWSRLNSTGKWKGITTKLVEMARYQLTVVPCESEDFIHYCSRAYRLLIMNGHYDEANQLAYYFKGELREVAKLLYHAKEYELSLKYSELWLEINPDDNSILWFKARSLTRLDQYLQAEEALIELEKTNFRRYKLYHAWGLLLRQQGKIEQAIEFFLKGLDAKHNFFPLLRDYGDALERSGNEKQALEVLREAHTLAPTDRYIVPKFVALLQKNGHVSEALSLIETFVIAYPEEAIYQHRISMLYGELGGDEKAYIHAKKSVELDESLYEAVLHLAALELKRDNLQEASDLMESLPSKLSYNQSQIRDTVTAEVKLKEKEFGGAREILRPYSNKLDPFLIDLRARVELFEASEVFANPNKHLAMRLLIRGKEIVEIGIENFPENYPLKKTLEQINALETQFSF